MAGSIWRDKVLEPFCEERKEQRAEAGLILGPESSGKTGVATVYLEGMGRKSWRGTGWGDGVRDLGPKRVVQA